MTNREATMETKPYSGPLKAGMKVKWNDGMVTALSADFEEAYVRRLTRPVRPAPDDAAAWALFVLDRSLPDAGVRAFTAGQTWAVARGVVEVIAVEAGGVARVRTLVGDWNGPMFPGGLARNGVLLFDAPAESPAPLRKLAEGWTRGGGGMACWDCHHAGCPALAAEYRRTKNSGTTGYCSVGYCSVHAEKAGVFSEPLRGEARGCRTEIAFDRCGDVDQALKPILCDKCDPPSWVTKTVAPDRCPTGKCAHAHVGPCTGTSPNGEFSCICCHPPKVAKHERPIVGKYGGTASSEASFAAMRRVRDEVDGERLFLKMLASETPAPVPPRTTGGFLTARIGGG